MTNYHKRKKLDYISSGRLDMAYILQARYYRNDNVRRLRQPWFPSQRLSASLDMRTKEWNSNYPLPLVAYRQSKLFFLLQSTHSGVRLHSAALQFPTGISETPALFLYTFGSNTFGATKPVGHLGRIGFAAWCWWHIPTQKEHYHRTV